MNNHQKKFLIAGSIVFIALIVMTVSFFGNEYSWLITGNTISSDNSTQNLSIRCSLNEECGAAKNVSYCKSGKLCTSYSEHLCNNPGSFESSCGVRIKELCNSCNQTSICVGGVCRSA